MENLEKGKIYLVYISLQAWRYIERIFGKIE